MLRRGARTERSARKSHFEDEDVVIEIATVASLREEMKSTLAPLETYAFHERGLLDM